MTTPSIGVSLICRNNAEQLKVLIPQLVEYFDQVVVVDTGSDTPETMDVARDAGAQVHEFVHDITVKEWDKTEKRTVDKTIIESFGAARQFSFDKLTTSWKAWCDTDDKWIGIDKVRSEVEAADAHGGISAFWAQYFYAQVKGNWVQVHKRERIINTAVPWAWHRRIHENLLNRPQAGRMVETDQFYLEHYPPEGNEFNEARARRNVHLLWREIHDDPKFCQPYFDLGRQFFNGGFWDRALAMYRKTIKLGIDPLNGYQALHHMAACWRAIGEPDKAEEFEWKAARLEPQYADHWFGLGETALMKRDPMKALWYNDIGFNNAKMPDRIIVVNPLDYTLHPWMTQHRAMATIGKLPEAIEVVTECLKLVPDHEDSVKALALYTAEHKAKEQADAMTEVAENLSDTAKLAVYGGLEADMRARKDVRDALIAPVLLHKDTADVTIWCGHTLESWGPLTPNLTGIGGSETAVIEIAKLLGEKGLSVAIYNDCGYQEGVYGNVRYVDVGRFDPRTPSRLFVAWRDPRVGRTKPKADEKWLWVHDCNYGPGFNAEDAANFDLIRPVSDWHGTHLRRLYPWLPKGQVVPTRNGIDLSRFRSGDERKRVTHRALWCSSPDRGLDNLLFMWGDIRKRVPDAELKVVYGLLNIERLIRLNEDPELKFFHDLVMNLSKQPGVEMIGRIPQDQLAVEMMQAGALAYCTKFLEVSMITAMEAMASGLVIVSSEAGAIPETTDGNAVLLKGYAHSDAYRKQYIDALVDVFENRPNYKGMIEKGKRRAKQLTWRNVADEWARRIVMKPSESKETVAA